MKIINGHPDDGVPFVIPMNTTISKDFVTWCVNYKSQEILYVDTTDDTPGLVCWCNDESARNMILLRWG